MKLVQTNCSIPCHLHCTIAGESYYNAQWCTESLDPDVWKWLTEPRCLIFAQKAKGRVALRTSNADSKIPTTRERNDLDYTASRFITDRHSDEHHKHKSENITTFRGRKGKILGEQKPNPQWVDAFASPPSRRRPSSKTLFTWPRCPAQPEATGKRPIIEGRRTSSELSSSTLSQPFFSSYKMGSASAFFQERIPPEHTSSPMVVLQ